MTWVKICGTTNLEDARAAAEAGADALGFVFAESPRRITPEAAAEITGKLPEEMDRVGVFVDETAEQIRETVERARLSAVQLHAEMTLERHREIYRVLRAYGVKIIEVKKLPEMPTQNPEKYLATIKGDKPFAFLFDTQVTGVAGGTGARFSWEQWGHELIPLRRVFPRIIVAGGLNGQNVAEAIRRFEPYGVDVASGVEREPGKKDHEKVKAFVKAVREAETIRG